ncbi:hypothetical protein L6452_06543 [Arctium lappa]|uniref:Uncharacterized protein n=1 Tax=Arctium lappa TaxID=4217 RepID=A0ACB9EJI1_ARCLA|nr:hypothetical protein L6452_06543 [Arctium lappa]
MQRFNILLYSKYPTTVWTVSTLPLLHEGVTARSAPFVAPFSPQRPSLLAFPPLTSPHRLPTSLSAHLPKITSNGTCPVLESRKKIASDLRSTSIWISLCNGRPSRSFADILHESTVDMIL